jgi:ComF family protein
VPLPLFAAKEKKRGYNQAYILCEGIAEVMNLNIYRDAVILIQNTESQTKKGRIERWQNIEGKFELGNAGKIQNKHVLLVDDVVTTGATLEACGHELCKVNGASVSIATLCYAR